MHGPSVPHHAESALWLKHRTDKPIIVLAPHVSSATELFSGGTLDFKLALIFRDCGHPDIADAVRSLDLLAAIPTHNAIPKR